MKYATLFPGGLFNFAFGLVINQDKWDKLAQAGPGVATRLAASFRRAAASLGQTA